MAERSTNNETLNCPAATAPLADWDQYLADRLSSTSGCKVRQSRIQQSPQAREQTLLKQLVQSAKISAAKTAISQPANRRQRQALDLIQLRRNRLPDDSPAWKKIEVFLAAAELHKAVELLLGEIEQQISVHDLLGKLMSRLHEAHSDLAAGRDINASELQFLVRSIIHAASDRTVKAQHWLTMCSLLAELESSERPKACQLPLASAFQTAYLCSRILKADSWGIDAEQLTAAALVKDVAFWHPRLSRLVTKKGHHTEWSAAMLGPITEFGVGMIRLVQQHHESLDGSGIPFGKTAVDLRPADRILGLTTRWIELFHVQIKSRNSYDLMESWNEVAANCFKLLLEETNQGRWEKTYVERLRSILIPERTGSSCDVETEPQHAWEVPRPKFMRSRFPVLGKVAK